MLYLSSFSFFFFFNDPATTEIYTLSLHDALPISFVHDEHAAAALAHAANEVAHEGDRKSTRLNSSHSQISYAVFCLKKKKSCKYNSTHKTNTKKKNKRQK